MSKSESEPSSRSGFVRFVYDGQTGAFFTRTPQSWAKIGLFYLVYYSCLAAFFAFLLNVFLAYFTDDIAPTLVGNYSILPQNPGMGFRPRSDVERTLISFSASDPESYADYVKDFEEFLATPSALEDRGPGYRSGQEMMEDCSGLNASLLDQRTLRSCRFLVDSMPDVVAECLNQTFGFPSGQPCVAVKLNRIFEFVPTLKPGSDKDFLEISCQGAWYADVDNIGHVNYFPQKGFNLTYFPYFGQKPYLSPLVFVKFTNVTRDVLVQVVCSPDNAANIKEARHLKGDGRVTFELLIWD